jgi:flagellar motor switch protein FliN/FliY
MDGQTTPEPANTGAPATGAGDGTAAERLAADALKSAQQAVSNLTTATGEGGGTPSAGKGQDVQGEAAMAAAMAAIGQAKAANLVGTASPAAVAGGTPAALKMPSFAGQPPTRAPEGMDLLSDVNLNVKIELGRTRMLVEDVLRLGEGSVVELDKLAGDPVDVYVNDRHVAKGEVLVLNDNFCVRINEIVAQVNAPG